MSCSVASPRSPSPAFSKQPTIACGRKGSPEPSLLWQPSAPPPLLRPPPAGEIGGSLLKRRRPAQIAVPAPGDGVTAAALEMVGPSEVEEEGDLFAVYCKRGRLLKEMEDRHVADLDLCGDGETAFFGVFDGHGGKKAAEYAAKNMARLIGEEIGKVDNKSSSKKVEAAVATGYKRTDTSFLDENVEGGSCCVTALIRKAELIVSNAGDCRAVLSREGKAVPLTLDHQPSRQDEKERIETLGGFVIHCGGGWRVQGSLAITRGIGDSHLKRYIIPDPETTTVPIDPHCEFLILASDGLWDKVSNQEAVDVARPWCAGNEKHRLLIACKVLENLSASRGSGDDISVLIIDLQN